MLSYVSPARGGIEDDRKMLPRPWPPQVALTVGRDDPCPEASGRRALCPRPVATRAQTTGRGVTPEWNGRKAA